MPAPPKFRPYFTSAELSEVISALKSNPTPTRMPLIRYLEGFAIEIERGIRDANYKPTPTKRQAFIESLELEDSSSKLDKLYPYEIYNRWLANPNLSSPAELAIIQQYRYECDLMSIDEEAEYESANGL